ncbi:MAG: hypothetical protein QOF49_1637, partial [Chloroflexota bacterium]|nr:hypothetical protein [Chloroflexota bacterium]
MDDETPGQIRMPAARPRRSAARIVLGRRTGYGIAHRRAATGRDRPQPTRGAGRASRIIAIALALVFVGSLAVVGAAAIGTV